MNSNYKPIGKYIQPVDERNNNLRDLPLVGLSITKEFIPSIANTIGTDMSTYRIIRRNQFAYSGVTSRNSDKITIALFSDYDEALISQAYTPFTVKDEKELNPEYLMMWFRRPEFDRYARFKSHGSAREIFDWDELCETLIPVLSIATQRAIVSEYNAIQNRININQEIIAKLEQTAQAVYKEWFVENVGDDWEIVKISSLCEITSSKRIFESEYENEGVPFYRGKEITQRKNGELITEPIYISEERYAKIIKAFGSLSVGDILMTAVGTIGSSYLIQKNDRFYFKDGNVIWFKNFIKQGLNYYLYDFMQSDIFSDYLKEITIGSTQSAITISTLGQYHIALPDSKTLSHYAKISEIIRNNINLNNHENQKLNELKTLLLSKLASEGRK